MELNSFVLHLFGFICRIRSSRFFSFFSCVLFRSFSVLCVRVCVVFSDSLGFFFYLIVSLANQRPSLSLWGRAYCFLRLSCVFLVPFVFFSGSSISIAPVKTELSNKKPTKTEDAQHAPPSATQQKQKTNDMHYQKGKIQLKMPYGDTIISANTKPDFTGAYSLPLFAKKEKEQS